MPKFITSSLDWLNSTHFPEQVEKVDIYGLFHNPYFLVPFILLIIYFLYKQAVTNLVITGLIIFLWWFSGTNMVREAIVDGVIQLDKILPIVGVGIGGIATLIYLVFIRED